MLERITTWEREVSESVRTNYNLLEQITTWDREVSESVRTSYNLGTER